MAHDDGDLTPLEEVQALVVGACDPATPRLVALDETLGCVLAGDLVAEEDIPPFANTAMDGYALRSEDTAGAPVELEVVGVLAAGSSSGRPVGKGEAVQIMTGAPLPPGADSVAAVERTEPGAAPGRVLVLDSTVPDQYVRHAGSDLRRGELALRGGTVLGPSQIGLAASTGASSLLVHPRPAVGVFSTGDELVGPGVPLGPGQIRDSNRHALLAALRRDGFVPVDLGVQPDDEASIRAAVVVALDRCDALVTSGGVSMGEFDFVKVVLDRLVAERGGSSYELKVAIKPAKPLSFATVARPGRPPVPIFGLPGNPVSALVSYQVVALPALRRIAGNPSPLPTVLSAIAGEAMPRRPDGKLHLVRVVVTSRPDGCLEVRSSGAQGSHQMASMAAAGGLALVPDGSGVAEGETVGLLLLDAL